MKEFVESLESKIKNLVASVDSDLEQLPPLEQVEAASEVSWGIRSLRSSAKFLRDQLSEMMASVRSEMAAMESSIKEGVMSEIQSGEEWIAKADHEAALELARKQEREKVEGEFQAAQEKEKASRSRCAELQGLLPEGVAVEFPSDLLSLEGDAFNAAKSKISERMAKLREEGYTSPRVYGEILSLAVDEAGDKKFEDKLSWWKELAGENASKPDPEKPAQSENQGASRPPAGAPSGAATTEKKKLLLA